MSVNRYRPYVYVLPEDDANRQIANGFLLDIALDPRAIQVLTPSGGWLKAIEELKKVHLKMLAASPFPHVVLLVDFDEDSERFARIQAEIPIPFRDRVFVLGVWSEPENLRHALRVPFETIGTRLAKECQTESPETWQHDLLTHNADELERMKTKLKPIVFPGDRLSSHG